MPGSPTTPLLSLCLATYNRARYLDRYLTHHLGALDAAGIDYELVVSDNCSTDETPEILARYASRYPTMRVTRQSQNVGAYPNILTTLHQARGAVVVSIADDDMMIPEQLLAYVQRLVDDPEIVMVQAPWLLVDEARDNAVTGKFYDFEGELHFEKGQFASCLAFLIQKHVFPECWIMRRSAIPGIAGPTPRFAYSFFWMLANALAKGDVLFCPEPYLRATAIAKGSNAHVGNNEAMESWDVYRGGLELLASYARQFNPGALPDAVSVADAIQGFVCQRMAVAAALQVQARNWSNAYQILRRLHAYELKTTLSMAPDEVARLAAIETAFLECSQLGASEIVVGTNVPEHILSLMNPIAGAPFIRPDAIGPDNVRRAYCSVDSEQDPSMRPQDFSCDIALVMERFPIFPANMA
jgi:hypothetical protein